MRLRNVLLAGLMARFLISPFFAHPVDVYAWYESGQTILDGSTPLLRFMTPYNYAFILVGVPATAAYDFLQKWIPTFSFSTATLNPALVPHAATPIALVPGLVFDLLVKLPFIASDTLIALTIHDLVYRWKMNDRLAVSAAALWFLNPLSIWVSAGWGTFDSLPSLCVIVALSLVVRERFAWAGLSIVVAAALKEYAIVVLPPLLMLAWKGGGRPELIKTVLAVAASASVILMPLLFGAQFLPSQLLGSSTSVPHYSGLSFWTAITLFSNFNPGILSAVAIACALAATYWWIWIRRGEGSDVCFLTVTFCIPIISLVLLYSFVGENFFIWILPLVAILAISDELLSRLYWCLSLIALVSSVTNSLLPFYLLPIAPWTEATLVGLLNSVASYRVAPVGAVAQGLSFGKVFLALLGISASIVLLGIVVRLVVDSTNLQVKEPAYAGLTSRTKRLLAH